MRKLLIIVAMIFLAVPFAFASDASIQIVSVTPIPSLANQATTFNLSANSDTATAARITYYSDGGVLSYQFINLDGVSAQSFSTQHSFPPGAHTFRADISDLNFSDANIENNSASDTRTYYTGYDFEVVSVIAEPNIYLPNTNLTVRADVRNNGDLNYSTNIPISFFYDGTTISTPSITGLGVNEEKTISISFVLPSNFLGQHTFLAFVDPERIITETNENNNQKNLTISDSSEVDLSVTSVTFTDSNIMANRPFTIHANIKNTGGKIANSVLIKAYHSSIFENNKIYETTISAIPAYSDQNISFDYTPRVVGSDKILVYADPNNSIVESNNENNYLGADFNIFAIDENNFAGLIIEPKDYYSGCSYGFVDSVGARDLLYVGDYDVNLTDYNAEAGQSPPTPTKIKLTYITATGSSIFDEFVGAGWQRQFPENGMTIRLVQFNKNYVSLIFVFQKAMVYTEVACKKQETDLLGQIAACQKTSGENYANYQTQLYKLQACETERDSCKTSRDACDTSLTTKNAEYTTLMGQLNTEKQECNDRITERNVENNNMTAMLVASRDQNVQQLAQENSDLNLIIEILLVFAAVAAGIIAVFVYLNEQKKGRV